VCDVIFLSLFIVCPRTVTITPRRTVAFVGDVFTCTSDGFPEPTYTWTDVDSGVTSDGPNISVTSEGTFHYTCTARNNAHDTSCDTSLSVAVSVMGKEFEV